ncbi:energy-coupling factor ABC transporter ATP-binding protein [Fictibacillus phosphorivorans]|uniref:energy-coupling factor ABC transporter ATP-binding protein n=1 Tax=Fictibacillus phosphorivorans TaxID=1221500 RepID=UPI00204123B7|nr:ABC transporter ATP-binding protein [Fictibacillus phosphorivorans]MCM3718640.1 energy-coupling factor ABC transporter ATP-binding protein [Fictibacillus phosphorivorans]MCM3776263.1 energy-coupling factor ABC transporter ATP-binding protein [Fictibacillus phosphorivorans]
MSAIEIRNLSYQYPTGSEEVLHNLNLTIESGKFYALAGVNGGGKTTLCNVIRGFIPHFFKGERTGKVLIEGKDVQDWDPSDLAQKVGFVFQNPFTQISGVKETVFDEIAFGLENLGVEVDVIRQRVQDIIGLLGIGYIQDKNPNELSGGQKQRVALASIIVMEPDILIFDEPTSQLDPQGTEEIFRVIDIMKKKGKTIILVEHKIELIAEYADYVIVLQDGEIKKQGRTEEVLADEATQDFGLGLTQYTLLDLAMRKQHMHTERIPITEGDSVSVMKQWMEFQGVKA